MPPSTSIYPTVVVKYDWHANAIVVITATGRYGHMTELVDLDVYNV
jgi:hypothetical protein